MSDRGCDKAANNKPGGENILFPILALKDWTRWSEHPTVGSPIGLEWEYVFVECPSSREEDQHQQYAGEGLDLRDRSLGQIYNKSRWTVTVLGFKDLRAWDVIFWGGRGEVRRTVPGRPNRDRAS